MNQSQLLRNHFDKGQSLTVLTAMQKFGIYALSQRAFHLLELAGQYRTAHTPLS